MRRRATILLLWLMFLMLIPLVAPGPLFAPGWAFALGGLAICAAARSLGERRAQGPVPAPICFNRMAAPTLHAAFHRWRYIAPGDGDLRRITFKTVHPYR